MFVQEFARPHLRQILGLVMIDPNFNLDKVDLIFLMTLFLHS